MEFFLDTLYRQMSILNPFLDNNKLDTKMFLIFYAYIVIEKYNGWLIVTIDFQVAVHFHQLFLGL